MLPAKRVRREPSRMIIQVPQHKIIMKKDSVESALKALKNQKHIEEKTKKRGKKLNIWTPPPPTDSIPVPQTAISWVEP